MTLIEVLVTILVITGGLLAGLAVFANAAKTTYSAQRKAQVVAYAEGEVEKLRSLPYASLGLSAAPPASASEAPLTAPASSEALVSPGLVNPGGDTFNVAGVSGRIYRYVTWRPQPCPAVRLKAQANLESVLGAAAGSLAGEVADLCPGTQHTKRITVVLKPDRAGNGSAPEKPVRVSTVVKDPDTTVLATAGAQNLRLANGTQTTPTTYTPPTQQELFLYDTRCSFNTRQAPTGSHPTHETSVKGGTCTGTGRPDLMGTTAPTGSVGDPLYDHSTDVTRPQAGGLGMVRDGVTAACQTALTYESQETDREQSIHTWASPALTAPAETALTAGRAAVTVHTRTLNAAAKAGRLCFTVWSDLNDAVLGSLEYQLPSWPGEITAVSVAFDLAHANLAVGDRLMLTVRVPPASQDGIALYYDHPAYPSSLTVTMEPGKELK